MKKPCVVLTGPTAVGKTGLSLGLAKKINGSVVSADSMQVYRGMDIGSAKIMPEEQRDIPHYLIDILEPEEEFNVFKFQQYAKAAMEEIWSLNRVPIITGGTGFYIQALLKDIDFTASEGKTEVRAEWESLAREKGPEYLHDLLKRKDPDSAEAIHPNNVKRVIRALEYYDETGSMISAANEEQRMLESPYDYVYFVLNDEREKLYRRIDRRVDRMLEEGLFEEICALKDRGLNESHISMKGIGYREWFPYFRGEISKEEAIRQIKLDTRHFAKRQLTWFRREQNVVWIYKPDFDFDDGKILKFMLEKIRPLLDRSCDTVS